MLYYLWYQEDTDIFDGYSTYEEYYHHVRATIVANESKFSEADVDDIDIDENGQPEHLLGNIAPNTEDNRSHSLQEGSESLTEITQDDANILNQGVPGSAISLRFESTAYKQEISADEYRQLIRGLNAKQQTIVMYHHRWCKNVVLALYIY